MNNLLLYNKLQKFYDRNEHNNYIMDKINITTTSFENLIQLISIFNWRDLRITLIENGFNFGCDVLDVQRFKNYLEKESSIPEKIKLYRIILACFDIYIYELPAWKKVNEDYKQKIQKIIKYSIPTELWNEILGLFVNVPNDNFNDDDFQCFHKSAFDIINRWTTSSGKSNDEKKIYISDWPGSVDIHEYFDISAISNIKNDDVHLKHKRKVWLYDKYNNLNDQPGYQYVSKNYWPANATTTITWPIVVHEKHQLKYIRCKYIQCKLIAICEIINLGLLNLKEAKNNLQNKNYTLFLQPIDDKDKIFNSNALISCDIDHPMSSLLSSLEHSMDSIHLYDKIKLNLKNYFNHFQIFKNFIYSQDKYDHSYSININLNHILHKNNYTDYICKQFPNMIQNLIFIIIDYSIDYNCETVRYHLF